MQNTTTYTTVDTILSKLNRDLKNTSIDKGDVVEWIGEALGFLQIAGMQEETVSFRKVKDFHCDLPANLISVLQISKLRDSGNHDCCDINMSYQAWTTSQLYSKFIPVRLSENVFFNTVVCKEKNYDAIYNSCNYEYKIVGLQSSFPKIRFSFQDGIVAISYLRTVLDEETGYPLIPDHITYISAITYYVKWKLAEFYNWTGVEGFPFNILQDMERKWIKYAEQATAYAKMPKSIDDYQNILEQSHNMINSANKYYTHFSTLGRYQNLKYNDPSHRNR